MASFAKLEVFGRTILGRLLSEGLGDFDGALSLNNSDVRHGVLPF